VEWLLGPAQPGYASAMTVAAKVTKRTAAAADTLDKQAIDWLLASDEPGIRMQARRDLLGESADDDAAHVLDGPRVQALFAGQEADGGFGVDVYGKWAGAHWRLVSLVELGIPVGEPRAVTAYETVLDWLLGASHRRVPLIYGLYRRCGSQEGNALTVGVRLGLAGDERVAELASSLIKWRWPDGGWNCDRKVDAHHSSFNETVTPMGGLGVYAAATGDADAEAAARRAAEFILDHEVYKSHRTGEVGNPMWLELRYPPFWRYDVLQGMVMLDRARALPDERATDAGAWLRGQQQPDGRWNLIGRPMWSKGGQVYRDPAAWERTGASQMLTLNALRVLRAQRA
jgi:hypothetical protein